MEPNKTKFNPQLEIKDNGNPRWMVYLLDGRHIPRARLIMMDYLHTKKIPKKFDVHHINGITDDDRIENLQLLSSRKHTALHHPRDYKYGVSRTEDPNAYQNALNKEPRVRERHSITSKASYQKNKLDPEFREDARLRAERNRRKNGIPERKGGRYKCDL